MLQPKADHAARRVDTRSLADTHDASAGVSEALPTVGSFAEDVAWLEASIRQLPPGEIRILEAGCGREWPLRLDGIRYTLTGLDLDAAALSARLHEAKDIDEAIVGDISRPGVIPPDTYDVVYSSFVLEHIEDAEAALGNMINGLKRGGILLLRIPDRYSVYGWTARRTPFFVHVTYYRFMGMPNAGKPGFAPYPTYHAPVVSRKGIRGFCARHRCSILHEHGHAYYLKQSPLTAFMMRVYVRAVWALSLGALAWRHDNLTYVIRRN
jgi:SAM-dependent methyltransferase